MKGRFDGDEEGNQTESNNVLSEQHAIKDEGYEGAGGGYIANYQTSDNDHIVHNRTRHMHRKNGTNDYIEGRNGQTHDHHRVNSSSQQGVKYQTEDGHPNGKSLNSSGKNTEMQRENSNSGEQTIVIDWSTSACFFKFKIFEKNVKAGLIIKHLDFLIMHGLHDPVHIVEGIYDVYMSVKHHLPCNVA